MTNFNKTLLIIFSYLPSIISICFAAGVVYFQRHWGFCVGFILVAICFIPKISVTNDGEVRNFTNEKEDKND